MRNKRIHAHRDTLLLSLAAISIGVVVGAIDAIFDRVLLQLTALPSRWGFLLRKMQHKTAGAKQIAGCKIFRLGLNEGLACAFLTPNFIHQYQHNLLAELFSQPNGPVSILEGSASVVQFTLGI